MCAITALELTEKVIRLNCIEVYLNEGIIGRSREKLLHMLLADTGDVSESLVDHRALISS